MVYGKLGEGGTNPLLAGQNKNRSLALARNSGQKKPAARGEFPDAPEVVTRCRDPFGFAQGRLFDSAETSLREVPAALRMTILLLVTFQTVA